MRLPTNEKENGMMCGMSKKSGFLKAVSLFLVFSFSFYNVSFAAADKTVSAPSSADIELSVPAVSVEDIGVAIDAGAIKSKYSGSSGKVIIHIQDAHCNFEAQSNINKILAQLTKENGIDMISVEGAEGLVDTAWFRAFPDAEIRKEVATYFMKKGEITGAEFFSINSDYEGSIFGAETRDYYVKNLKAFTEVYPYKDQIEKYLTNTQVITSRLKSIVYHPELKAVDSKIKSFKEKETELSGYAEYLRETALKNKIDIKPYENFGKLLQTLEYEGKIDFDIVDQERTTYIDLLSKKLPKQEMTELVAQSIKFKKGHIEAVHFYSYLRDLARVHDIAMVQEYPNLFYYYIYTKLYDGINNENLFREIAKIETSLKEKLFKDDTQRDLDKYAAMLDMYAALINIELTNEDYDQFKAYSEEFTMEDVLDFIRRLSARYNLNYSIEAMPIEIKERLPNMVDFYEIAMKRDNALIDNTLQKMKEDGKDRCVLIAGGFHTRGIKHLLEKKGVSYVVVTPKITKDVETPYIKVLTNQRTSLEDIITESVAMPASGMKVSNEEIVRPKADFLAPRPKIFSCIPLLLENPKVLEMLGQRMGVVEGKSLKDSTEYMHNEVISCFIKAWLIKEREKADAKVWKKAVKNWPWLLGAYLKAYKESAEKAGVKLSKDLIVSEWGVMTDRMLSEVDEEFRNIFKNVVTEKSFASPGQQAARIDSENDLYESLTTEQADAINSVIAQLMKVQKPRPLHFITSWGEIEACVLDGFKEAMEEYNVEHDVKIPMDVAVHPGTGKGQWTRFYIDSRDWDALNESQKHRLATHERYHIANPGHDEQKAISVLQDELMDVRAKFEEVEGARIIERGNRIFKNAHSAMDTNAEVKLEEALTEAYILTAEYDFIGTLSDIINQLGFSLIQTPEAENLYKKVFLRVAEKYSLWMRKDLMDAVNDRGSALIEKWFKGSSANKEITPKDVVAVIMAGGGGERLTPLSTTSLPKQLANVIDVPLIVMAVDRLIKELGAENIYIDTVPHLRNTIYEMLKSKGIKKENIFAEPKGADTAGAIGYAAAKLKRLGRGNDVMFVGTADHYIDVSDNAFKDAYMNSAKIAKNTPSIGTIGIDPTPIGVSEEYGCIEKGKGTFFAKEGAIIAETFIEKPKGEKAQTIFDDKMPDGSHKWLYNSGMFIGRPEIFLKAFEIVAPYYGKRFRSIAEADFDNAEMVEKQVFDDLAGCKAQKKFPHAAEPEGYRSGVSIDYVLAQPLSRGETSEISLFLIPGEFNWMDIGGYKVVHKYYKDVRKKNDASNNVIVTPKASNVVLENCSNCLVIAEDDDVKITLSDMESALVVYNSDTKAVMVAPLDVKGDSIKMLLAQMKNRKGFSGYISGDKKKIVSIDRKILSIKRENQNIIVEAGNGNAMVMNSEDCVIHATIGLAIVLDMNNNRDKIILEIVPQQANEDMLLIKVAKKKELSEIKSFVNTLVEGKYGEDVKKMTQKRTMDVLKNISSVFENQATKAKSDEKTLKTALGNFKEWMTVDKFREYHEALLDLAELAMTDEIVAKELYDSFWRTIPFGTGGRRWRMGIGPNRMNAYMAAMTAQGHCEYLKDNYSASVKAGDVVIGAWDVREFHKFFAEVPSLKQYREIIEAKCPALAGLSSEHLSKVVGLVYAGNGITYVHSDQMRSTPWLSLLINKLGHTEQIPKFTGVMGKKLKKIKNVMSGVVLSSSHNPYDNNGTKFYEHSGSQAPPQTVQKLMDRGNEVDEIKYAQMETYYTNGRDAAFDKAVENGEIIILNGGNLREVDEIYINIVIEEIKSVCTDEEWDVLGEWFEKLIVSFNAINGTGITNLLPVLEKLKVDVIRSRGDVPSYLFDEGYGQIPNPEVEKTFNTAMQIGVERTIDWLLNVNRELFFTAVIDEDGEEIRVMDLEKENKKKFTSAKELLKHVKETREKYLRGVVINSMDETNAKIVKDFAAFSLPNNMCLLTDPDADRIGLGMLVVRDAIGENVSISEIEQIRAKELKFQWISANDNDEAGIMLFRHRLEKLLTKAQNSENGMDLIKYIEGVIGSERIRQDQSYQLVAVNTVVSNPLEIKIAEAISQKIKVATNGKVEIKVVTHHVGFKFTGEVIDLIAGGEYHDESVVSALMRKADIDLKKAVFVLSTEEGEGSLVGARGSIDKDSGTTGLALTVLAAEQLAKSKTVHDYLMETYKKYGYSKVYLEPMVMTGEYGFNMINDKIMGYLRDTVLEKLKVGQPVNIGRFTFTEGMDHYDLMKPAYGENPADWPQAIRESVNILEFTTELENGIKIKIIARPSGTEPKQKNVVMVIGTPDQTEEEINNLNREVMDAIMTTSYMASEAEYVSIVENKGKYEMLSLSEQDVKELLKIFPVVVSIEAKLGIYFPLRDWIKELSQEMVLMNDNEYNSRYAEAREKIGMYLVNFKETNGVQFVEESVRMHLKYQSEQLKVDENIVQTQAVLWFGHEIGSNFFGKPVQLQADSPGIRAVRTGVSSSDSLSQAPSVWQKVRNRALRGEYYEKLDTESRVKYLEALKVLNDLVQAGEEIPVKPYFALGINGYTWGEKVKDSSTLAKKYGLKTIQDKVKFLRDNLTVEQKEILKENYEKLSDSQKQTKTYDQFVDEEIENTEVAEQWYETGGIDVGTGFLLPLETLSFFQGQVFSQEEVDFLESQYGLTVKRLTSSKSLSIQMHYFPEMFIPLRECRSRVSLTADLTHEEYLAACGEAGTITNYLEETTSKPFHPVVLPPYLTHAYIDMGIMEIKGVTPDKDPSGTLSFVDRLKFKKELEAKGIMDLSMKEAELRKRNVEKRYKKDVLTMDSKQLKKTRDWLKKAEESGMLKHRSVSELQTMPELVSAPETQDKAKFEIMGRAPGAFISGMYTIAEGEFIGQAEVLKNRHHPLVVEDGDVTITTSKGRTFVKKQGEEIIMYPGMGTYTIKSTRGKALVFSAVKPLPEVTKLEKPINVGEEIAKTGTHTFRKNLFFADNQIETNTFNTVEIVGNQPVEETVGGRELKLTGQDGTVTVKANLTDGKRLTAQIAKGDSLTIPKDTESYTITKTGMENALVRIDHDNAQEEKDVCSAWKAVAEERSAIAKGKYAFIAPRAMYAAGESFGSRKWEKDTLNEYFESKDCFDITVYSSEVGLTDTSVYSAITNAVRHGRIPLLVATQKLFDDASKDEKFRNFLKENKVRIVPPIPSLEKLGNQGWFFTREVESKALLQGLLTVDSIKEKDEFAQKVRKVVSQSLRRSVDINELYYLVGFGDDLIPAEYRPKSTLEWMVYMINAMLQRMDVKPYDAYEKLEKQRRTMYSV